MSPDLILWTLVLAAGAAVLVRATFSELRSRWPESYFAIDTGHDVDPIAARSLGRFIVWRTAPVAIGAAGLAVSLERLDLYPWIGGLAYAIVYGQLSFGPAIYLALVTHRSARLPKANVLLHLSLLTLSVVVVITVTALRMSLFGLVPTPAGLVEGVWVALLVVAVSRVVNVRQTARSTKDLVARSRRELGAKLLDPIAQIATEHEIDPRVVEAVMHTENLQRPKWVRALERIQFPLVESRRTYGVMQVASAEPIDDLDSIKLACGAHLRGIQVSASTYNGVRSYDTYHTTAIASASYNSNPAWTNLFGQILDELCPAEGSAVEESLRSAAGRDGPDGSPAVQVLRTIRDQRGLQVIGDYQRLSELDVLHCAGLDDAGAMIYEFSVVPSDDRRTPFNYLFADTSGWVAIVFELRSPGASPVPACRAPLSTRPPTPR